jgi:hypothetical protein
LVFPSPQIGYSIGIGRTQNNNADLFDNFLLKTVDSGLTWNKIKSFPNSLSAIHFLNTDTGFIGTESGVILKTTDGGVTWNETWAASNSLKVNSIQFISEMTGFAVGGSYAVTTTSTSLSGGGFSFFVSKTSNGGRSWESYDTIGLPLYAIYFLNDTTGFVSGSGNLIMKSNGTIDELPGDYPWHLVDDGSFIKEEKTTGSGIKIYPNPTSGKLKLQWTDVNATISTVKLYNSSGQVIEIKKPELYSKSIQFDLTEMMPGLYFIQIIYSDKTEMMKIFKK